MKIYETPWLRLTSQRISAYNGACIVNATFSASADNNNSFNCRNYSYFVENKATAERR